MKWIVGILLIIGLLTNTAWQAEGLLATSGANILALVGLAVFVAFVPPILAWESKDSKYLMFGAFVIGVIGTLLNVTSAYITIDGKNNKTTNAEKRLEEINTDLATNYTLTKQAECYYSGKTCRVDDFKSEKLDLQNEKARLTSQLSSLPSDEDRTKLTIGSYVIIIAIASVDLGNVFLSYLMGNMINVRRKSSEKSSKPDTGGHGSGENESTLKKSPVNVNKESGGLTKNQLKKLSNGVAVLKGRGEKVSATKLRTVAKVGKDAAREYLKGL